MDGVHIHLLLNHIPILGTLFGILILLAGLLKNNRTLIVTALVTFIITALITIPTNLSGEDAEHAVEKLPGVTEQAIEDHEHAAEPAMIVALVLGALSLGTLFFMRRGNTQAVVHQGGREVITTSGASRYLPWAVMLLSIVSFILMVRVGGLGGEIRHTELNPGSGTSAPAETEHDSD